MAVTERVRTDKNGKRIIRYEAEVFVGGVRFASQSFKTKAAAYVWHDETKKKAESGAADPGGGMTLGETVSAYQATAFRELRKSSQNRVNCGCGILKTLRSAKCSRVTWCRSISTIG